MRFIPALLIPALFSCELFYAPGAYDKLNSSSSSSSSSSPVITNSVTNVTLYIAGQDPAGGALWTVTMNGTVTNIVKTVMPNSVSASWVALNGDTLYIAGRSGVSPNYYGCYWTVKTNGGTPVENDVTPVDITGGYGCSLFWIGFDPNGNLCCTGDDENDYQCYWLNGIKYTENSAMWGMPYNLVFSGGNYYTVGYNNGSTTSWLCINNPVQISIPGAGWYLGGLVVNNGVIYVSGTMSSVGNSSVWISSNSGATFNTIPLNGTVNDCAYPCYFGSYLYLPGISASSYPCYWTLDSYGNTSQVILDHVSTGEVKFMIVTNNTVFSAGIDNSQPVYWIGTSEYILDTGGNGIGLVVTYNIVNTYLPQGKNGKTR